MKKVIEKVQLSMVVGGVDLPRQAIGAILNNAPDGTLERIPLDGPPDKVP